MFVKKVKGKIFGAKLTATEQKALTIELQKQQAEFDRKNSVEIEAMALWVLYSEFDFEAEQLKRFHDSFIPTLKNLCDHYDMDEEDMVWLCTHKLKERGIDVAAWNKELGG